MEGDSLTVKKRILLRPKTLDHPWTTEDTEVRGRKFEALAFVNEANRNARLTHTNS